MSLGTNITANQLTTLPVPVDRLTAVSPHRLGWIGLDPEERLGDLLAWTTVHPRATAQPIGRIEAILFLCGLLALTAGTGMLANREALPMSRRFLAWLLFISAVLVPVSALGYLQDRLLSGGTVSFAPALLSRGVVVFLLGLVCLQAGLRRIRRHQRRPEEK
jgi:hypothetical protein